MELCRFFNKTPLEIGELRRKDPMGIAFIERRIIWEAEERDKHRKKMEKEVERNKRIRKR